VFREVELCALPCGHGGKKRNLVNGELPCPLELLLVKDDRSIANAAERAEA